MASMRRTQCATDASFERGTGLTGQRSTFCAAGLLGVDALGVDAFGVDERGVCGPATLGEGVVPLCGFANRSGGWLIVAISQEKKPPQLIFDVADMLDIEVKDDGSIVLTTGKKTSGGAAPSTTVREPFDDGEWMDTTDF